MEIKNVGLFIGNIGQWTAAVLCGVGALLIIHRSGLDGSSFIIVGSLFFAVFTKIKYYRRDK